MQPQQIQAAQGENPYFVLGAHLAMLDQIKTDRPQGIQSLYYASCKIRGSNLTEEMILQVLKQLLLSAYQHCEAPSDEEYLETLKKFCQ